MKEKYIDLILEKCLNVSSEKSLFISCPKYCKDFVDLVIEKAKALNIGDIYTYYIDYDLKRKAIDSSTIDELYKNKLFNMNIYDEYARKDACFLNIVSLDPLVMNNVDIDKFNKITAYERTTMKLYKEKQSKGLINWTIIAVPNQKWADEIYPKMDNNLQKLWEDIYKMCLIFDDDPKRSWDIKFKLLEKRCRKLNNMELKTLHYKNKLGTDLKIDLPDNYIWLSALENNFIANMPTEEIFTSPHKYSANGKIVSTKPLLYNNSIIDKFYIDFENGKVISYDAKIGKEVLKGIIESDESSCYLGEVALVDYSSSISKLKTVYKETLIDENASCHLALGNSFPECIENGLEMNNDKLIKKGLNSSKTHVDFMIGSKDLEIEGITKDGRRIKIMSKGNIVL